MREKNDMKIKQDAEKSMSQSKGHLKHILRQMTMKKQLLKNLWDIAKDALREKFMVIQAFLKKKKEKSQINNPTYHLKGLEKE